MPTMRRLDFRREPVTIGLLAVIVALEVFFSLRPDEVRRDVYIQWMGIWWQIWDGQLWRPFTSCLGHVNLIHMLFNAAWLIVFGPVLEERFGSWRTLGLIVLLSYVSILPEYIVQGEYVFHRDLDQGLPMILGFSGVIYGFFGLIFIGCGYVPQWQAVCDQRTVNLFVGWFLLCIVLTVTDLMPVANIAHGAGFVFGALYGLAIFDRAHRPRWIALSAVLTLLVLGTMIACPGHVHYEHVREARGLLA